VVLLSVVLLPLRQAQLQQSCRVRKLLLLVSLRRVSNSLDVLLVGNFLSLVLLVESLSQALDLALEPPLALLMVCLEGQYLILRLISDAGPSLCADAQLPSFISRNLDVGHQVSIDSELVPLILPENVDLAPKRLVGSLDLVVAEKRLV